MNALRGAALVVGMVLGLWLNLVVGLNLSHSEAAPPPPSGFQVNPDIYACCSLPSVFSGWTAGDLSTLNPVTTRLRAGGRSVSYSYVVVPGCSDGNMEANLNAALKATTQVTGLSFLKVASGADVRLRATCGTDAANVGVTGGVVGDLYPNWPYEDNVNINTIMATYPDITQQSIWLHEFPGHGIGTWDEGYYKNGSFGSVPGLIDFMNTGPDSRYVWPPNDVDRFCRTLYDICGEAPAPVVCATLGFDPCTGRFFQGDGWSYDPVTAKWIDPQGRERFGPCNSDRLRLDLLDTHWWRIPGQNLGFDYSISQFVVVPSC